MKKILKPLVFSMMMSLPFISCIGAEGEYNYSDEQNEKPLLFSETTIPDIFFASCLLQLVIPMKLNKAKPSI